MDISPNIQIRKFSNIIKFWKFYSGYMCIHHQDSIPGFLSVLTLLPTYSSAHPCVHQSIFFFFYALQRILQISVNFSLITSMCYQHLDCDLLWWMAYVFKMTVQKWGLVVRPLQRNGNLRIKSWTMALLCELKSLMCCMYIWIPSSLPGDQGHSLFLPCDIIKVDSIIPYES